MSNPAFVPLPIVVMSARIGELGKNVTLVNRGNVTARRRLLSPLPSIVPSKGAARLKLIAHDAGSPTQLPWPFCVTVRGSHKPKTGGPFSFEAACRRTVAFQCSVGLV